MCGTRCVDFTSDQDNCGGCGKPCGAGTTCWGSTCRSASQVVMATPYAQDTLVATDGTSIYWLDVGDAEVLMMPLGGSSIATLGQNLGLSAGGLLVANGNVYWVDDGIVRASISGGAPTTIVTGVQDPNFSVDSSNAYWTVFGSQLLVMKQPLNGTTPVQLANFTAGFGPGLSSPPGMGVQSGNVYWYGNGALLSTPVSGGGTIATLADPETGAILEFGGGATELAMDSTAWYWANGTSSGVGSPTIVATPLAGGQSATLATLAPGVSPAGLLVDGGFVYWFDSATGIIGKVPVSGGDSITVFQSQATGSSTYIGGIAVDASNLYFSSEEGIFAVTPK
jgi:hypothetical protein